MENFQNFCSKFRLTSTQKQQKRLKKKTKERKDSLLLGAGLPTYDGDTLRAILLAQLDAWNRCVEGPCRPINICFVFFSPESEVLAVGSKQSLRL